MSDQNKVDTDVENLEIDLDNETETGALADSTEEVVDTDFVQEQDLDQAEDADAEDTDTEDTDGAEAETREGIDEGDIAADYLEELLDIADIDGDIEIEVRNSRTYISIVADGAPSRALENLVGAEGEVLDALQELTRLAALAGTNGRSRLILDIAGHRVDKGAKVKRTAVDAVEKAKTSGHPVSLRPMSAYERKLVHDAVAELGAHSESEGEGAARHVVVTAE